MTQHFADGETWLDVTETCLHCYGADRAEGTVYCTDMRTASSTRINVLFMGIARKRRLRASWRWISAIYYTSSPKSMDHNRRKARREADGENVYPVGARLPDEG